MMMIIIMDKSNQDEKERKILVIFKFYKNNIQPQYFTYLEEKDEQPYTIEIDENTGELPLDDIDSIVEHDTDPLEKEWLKVVTTDHFTLSTYGSRCFKVFVKHGKTDLINETYKKCIHLIKADIKKNLNSIDIINSSIRELIKKDSDYFNRFILDTLILLNPTKGSKIGRIHFTDNHFTNSYFTDKHFTDRVISPTNVLPTIISPTQLFH